MRESNLSVRLKRHVHPPKHITANTQYILRAYANMILLMGVTQETIYITDPNDAIIPKGTIKVTRYIAHDRLIACRDMSYEAPFCSETTHAII